MRPFNPEPWQDQGACVDEDPELFFPVGEGPAAQAQAREAKAVCRGCDVQLYCLDYAVRSKATEGVWGGIWLTGQKLTRARVRRETEVTI